MRSLAISIIAAALLATPALAQQPHPGGQPPPGQPGQPPPHEYGAPSPDGPRWSRGDRLPDEFRNDRYRVTDWRARNLRTPPAGYRWYCYQHGDCFLVRERTGIIRQPVWRDERNDDWRRRYTRSYSYNDDIYYRECRERPDPGGVILGGLIGGLIGHAAGRDRDEAATFMGIIIGSALGAALTRDLDCEDRSYAYPSFYRALNGYRIGRVYTWRNPRSGHHGEFSVQRYYYDGSGFRCADYRHIAYADRRREARGHACRQADGAWAFLN